MNARVAATRVMVDVIQNGRSLSDALTDGLKTIKQVRDQAFAQALCFGVCRWYFYLDAIANELLEKPLKAKDQDIHILLLMGLYQLIDMRIPDYAAVGETVAVTKSLKKIWAKNLVNGVLRQYQRSAETINEKIKNDLCALYMHPDWLIEKIKKDWPEEWKDILIANNQHPPFSLRVNKRFHSREEYTKQLPAYEIISETQSGFILTTPVDVSELPGFEAGHVSVQDGAAQLAAELLMLAPGQRILDACAAPGGKTAHIAELQSDIAELIAIDRDKRRLDVVVENLQRLQLTAKCISADAAELDSWWDGKYFDRILLDAPCSATGVIRRHPDIKLLRRETDVASLVKEQQHLLTSLWRTLKPGGILLYATCSIFHEENDAIIVEFLKKHADAQEEKISASWGKECIVGRQILPGMQKMDGFYYARLRKKE
jgi:16S rRNA (cytosine967-C5)-methyltransferase